MRGGFGEARFELFHLEIKLHASVKLLFLRSTCAEVGDFSIQLFVLRQGGAATLSDDGISSDGESSRVPGSGMGLKALDPALVESV